ncbi:hypothetical protein KUTeg_012895 [Tegillarca granosa]|uniref:Uncharacterized protein n=1 Tax=Tegillarca granosa TaxID=220873 RepID=A0ABQ9EVM9_TEGGR|nr:hypothetical protein KUTeg_012895 [Tegillarca granosa]
MERDEETLRENRWPFKSSRTTPRSSRLEQEAIFYTSGRFSDKQGYLSTSLDSIPAKSTAAADLRASRVKKQFTTLSQKEKEELEKRRKQRIREMRIRKSIDERASISDSPSIEDKTRERLKKYREDERARIEDYQKELDEMRNRVESRPLLFEQQSETRSSRTVSITGDDDDYEEDFDDTDVKTGVQKEDLEQYTTQKQEMNMLMDELVVKTRPVPRLSGMSLDVKI